MALLSPGPVLFLYGSDHLSERTGWVTLIVSITLLATFFRTAANKGDRALIDLRLFKGKIFSAAVITQFMANGIAFAGQMLIPIYLIRACGRSLSATGFLLAPLGLGMMCCYPLMGTLTNRFGIRRVSAGGAFLAFCWHTAIPLPGESRTRTGSPRIGPVHPGRGPQRHRRSLDIGRICFRQATGFADGYNFSVAVWVGYIALFGIAVETGVGHCKVSPPVIA